MKILKIAFFIVLISILVGCVTRPVVIVVDSESRDDLKLVESSFNLAPNRNIWLSGASVMLKGTTGNVKDIQSKLWARKILIAKKNNTVLLIIPNTGLFETGSANFINGAYTILDLVVDLLGYYDNPYLVITGYGSVKYLAAERASRVRKYLWNAGIDASFVYSKNGNEAAECVVIKYKE